MSVQAKSEQAAPVIGHLGCPVCGHLVKLRPCQHLLPAPRRLFESLKPFASTPLDLGVARFAAEVIALTSGGA